MDTQEWLAGAELRKLCIAVNIALLDYYAKTGALPEEVLDIHTQVGVVTLTFQQPVVKLIEEPK